MWKVTKNRANLIDGKLYRSHDFEEKKFKAQPTVKFRLLDDDGEVYFEGLITKQAIFNSPAPLDLLGVGFGCTEAQYREEGAWVSL